MAEGERSDAELVEDAHAGSAAAFATLLHRHAAAVHATVADATDPIDATTATFTDAMRSLAELEPGHAVGPWLLGLAARHTPRPHLVEAGPVPPLGQEQIDAIWAELDARWPDGHRSRRIPRWVGWAALVGALVGLAILIPYALLTAPPPADDPRSDELLAVPFDDPAVQDEDLGEAPVLADDVDVDELPSFQFPDEPAAPAAPVESPADAPAPPPEPIEDEPAPDPEPEPDPDPGGEPEPPPEPEPDPPEPGEEPGAGGAPGEAGPTDG